MVSRPRALLVEGRPESTRGLSGLVAFGTSMLPFFRPGAELWTEEVPPASVLAGDLIAFRLRSGALVTHRVLKVLDEGGARAFLTKGDNRLDLDDPVREGQLEGRVARVGLRDVRTPGWRLLGRLVARLSYAQALAYRRLARGRLNRLRYRLQGAGWLPAVRLRGVFRALTDPLSAPRAAAAAWEAARDLRARAGLSIGTWSADQAPEMARLWNESFPTHRTDPERLLERLCRGPAFDPEGCFLARRAGGPLLGWVLANPAGVIEVLAVAPGQDARTGRLLLRQAAGWLRRRGFPRPWLGPHWVPDSPLGPRWSGLLECSSPLGFEPLQSWSELALARADRRPGPRRALPEGLEVRPWREGDDPAIERFLLAHRYGHALELYRGYARRRPERTGVRLAWREGRLLAFCRWIEDRDVEDYGDLTWVWCAERAVRPRGYFLHLLVDERERGRGIGTAMAARAFKDLWERGCEEIRLCVIEEGLYEPFGFKRKARFLRLRPPGGSS